MKVSNNTSKKESKIYEDKLIYVDEILLSEIWKTPEEDEAWKDL